MKQNRILLWSVLFDLALIIAALMYFSDQYQMPDVMRPYWTKAATWLRSMWPTIWPGSLKPWASLSR
jgi:hypothetical protein